MLIATKTEEGPGGTIRVEVAGLMLEGEGRTTVRDAVCVCAADSGEIREVRFSTVVGDPEFFGERQAKHLRALCESVCKRVAK